MVYQYDYKEDVYNTADDVNILQQRIEDNFKALVRNFKGSDEPPPGETFEGQLWYNTGQGTIEIRKSSNWVPIFDVASGSSIIADGSVTSSKISSSARKGTIVQDQSISPAVCTLKAKRQVSGAPQMDNLDREKTVTSGSWTSVADSLTYFPSGASTLYMYIRARLAGTATGGSIRIRLSSNVSATISVSGSSYLIRNTSVNIPYSNDVGSVIIEAQVSGGGIENKLEVQGYTFFSL